MDSDPHVPPTAPSSGHHHHHQRSPDRGARDDAGLYNDEDGARRQHDGRAENTKASPARGHDSVISPRFSPRASSPPSPSSSISSAGRKHLSIDQVHQSPYVKVTHPPQAHIDPEKAISSPRSNRVSSSNADVPAAIYDSGEYLEKGPEEKAFQLLLFLSGPCAFLSLAITLWTIFLLFVALLMQPLRICSTRQSLSSQITSFLSPPLNLQLHLVYSHSAATEYRPAMLVVVHLFAPIVAVGVAIASWTSAFFWFFSMILGDPAGQDGHNDGKDSLLGVRNWWERWLSRGLK